MEQGETRAQQARFGVYEVDLKACELRRQGLKVKLHGRPFDVLALLLAEPGEIVTREELRQRLWSGDTFVDFDHGLNNAVNKLREALGDSAENPRFVETLPRRGYRFIAPVEWLNGGPRPETATHQPARMTPGGHRARTIFAGLAVALVLGLAHLGWNRPSPPLEASDQKVMLAVLPFENLGDNPEQEYFSDGLTDEMITRLGRLRPERLGVIARTSAMQYKSTDKPLPEIAQELGVGYILEGSVRQDGSRVRITASLVQTADQTALWTESYDRDLADIFSLQDEVAQSVARSLAVELLPRLLRPAGGEASTNTAAYEAYLKGQYFSRQGRVKPPAAKYYQEAIALDPNFAPAYAGLANSLLFQTPATQTMPRARQAALKALELDPALPDAHSALGLVNLMYEWDWEGAERAFQHALRLDPANPETYLRYSNYLAAMGRLDQAITAGRRAQQLDPLAPLPRQTVGRYLTFQGRLDEAVAEYRKTLELDPNFFWGHLFISFIYEQKGDYDRWIDHQIRAWRSSGVHEAQLEELGAGYRIGGHQGGLRVLNAWREQLAARGITPSAALALDYIRLGEKEKALYWLQRAFENHTRDLIYLNVEPQYDPIRDDPRFQEIVRRIGLPARPEAEPAN